MQRRRAGISADSSGRCSADMEVSPLLLSELLLFSLLWGCAVGVINDASRIIRVFFGVRYTERRFERICSLAQIHVRGGADSEKCRDPEDGKTDEGRSEKRLKRTSRALGVLIFFQDIFLMLTAAVGLVILNFYLNDGDFRFYTVVCLICGFVFYYFTVGKLVMLISEPITLILKAIFCVMIRLLLAPVRMIGRVFMKIFSAICKRIRLTIAKRREMRYNIRKSRLFTELSRTGFTGERAEREEA